MSHTVMLWEKINKTRLRDRVEINKQIIWIYARKGNYRYLVCLKNINRKVQGRSKRATLCICGPRTRVSNPRSPKPFRAARKEFFNQMVNQLASLQCIKIFPICDAREIRKCAAKPFENTSRAMVNMQII